VSCFLPHWGLLKTLQLRKHQCSRCRWNRFPQIFHRLDNESRILIWKAHFCGPGQPTIKAGHKDWPHYVLTSLCICHTKVESNKGSPTASDLLYGFACNLFDSLTIWKKWALNRAGRPGESAWKVAAGAQKVPWIPRENCGKPGENPGKTLRTAARR